MGTTIERTAVALDVDPELLEHRTHLPETISCVCGYRRGEAGAN
ncbi:hypothetical protein [Microbacterium sp. E-13]